jgi:hypothetical protein
MLFIWKLLTVTFMGPKRLLSLMGR